MLKPVVGHAADAPAYWLLGILWIILADGDDTGGRWSLMEQLMPAGAGPPPHVHPFNDESFYVLDGEMEMILDDSKVNATAGKSVWIPRGVVHSFRVLTPTCRVLNVFDPAGMEQVIKTLGKPAAARSLPPASLKEDDKTLAAFANNYWGMEADVPFARTRLSR